MDQISNDEKTCFVDDKISLSKNLLNLGRSYQFEGKNEEAIKSNEQAVQFAEGKGQYETKVSAYEHLGKIFTDISEYEKAIENYEKARESSLGLEANKMEVIPYERLGYNNLQAVKYRDSIECYNKVVTFASQLGENQKVFNAYIGLGSAFNYIGEFHSSKSCFLKALNVANQLKDERLEREAHKHLAQVYYNTFKFDAAIKSYLKVQEISHDLGEKLEEASAYLKLGRLFQQLKQHENAIEYYRKAIEFSKELDDKKMHARAVKEMGELFLTLASDCNNDSDHKKAIGWYEKALAIFETEFIDYLQLVKALTGLGIACFHVGDAEKAIICLRKAQRFATTESDRDSIAEILHEYKKPQEQEASFSSVTADPPRINVADTEENLREPNATTSLVQLEGGNNVENLNNSAHQIASPTRIQEDPASWQWIKKSIVHRESLMKLHEYAKHHPDEIQDINGVRVCCSTEFLIDKGSEGTRVYVGLGKDGVEKAVKRLLRDECTDLAKQEKKVLNELNAMKSDYVVKYWFLEEKSDKDHLFLILDLCEETLKKFVERSSETDLIRYAPDIMKQVLKGLVDLHRGPNPILHRDLKPSNILRDVENNWLLADFGISRILTVGAATHVTEFSGTEDWMAVESYFSKGLTDDNTSGKVRCKKESDIQVAGMVAFHILTKGKHPFGERPDRLHNLLHGKPVGLNMLKDDAAKDLICWMLSHDPKDRPSANEALKHPYLQPQEKQFELLCEVGNQPEIKTQDVKSDVVRKLNSNPEDWTNRIAADVFTYLSTDSLKGRTTFYRPSWTDCLRLIRNVKQHWHDRPRPRPEVFYIVENPQKYFLNLFPSLSVEVHKIIRSCDWKERDDLKRYFAWA